MFEYFHVHDVPANAFLRSLTKESLLIGSWQNQWTKNSPKTSPFKYWILVSRYQSMLCIRESGKASRIRVLDRSPNRVSTMHQHQHQSMLSIRESGKASRIRVLGRSPNRVSTRVHPLSLFRPPGASGSRGPYPTKDTRSVKMAGWLAGGRAD